MAEAALDAPVIAPRARGQVAAAVVGNALEFYDFIVYTTFAVQIGAAFFPGKTQFFQLLSALIALGVGFVSRPIGAIVIGRLGDRYGRKPAMLLTFGLMGLGIVGLTLTPSYATIGYAAPVLVLVFRLIQGFALGGEVGPTTAFLVEAAGPHQRGLFGAWQGASQGLASLAGAAVGIGVVAALGSAALESWGWRLAIGLGAVILPIGYVLRQRLIETAHEVEAPTAVQPQSTALLSHTRILALGVGLIMSATIATYVFSFLTPYATTFLKMSAGVSLGVTVVTGAAIFFGSLAGGWLSDLFGRRALMIWPRLAVIVLAVPGFQLIIWRRDGLTLFAVAGVLAFLNSASSSPAITALTESVRKEVRSVAVAATYSIAVAVFGGSTQPIVAWLIHVTGDNLLVPGFYMAGASVVALAAAMLMRESRPALPAPASGR
jgi:MFS family permease